MSWAAGGGGNVDVEDVELGTSYSDGDALDFYERVVGVGWEVSESYGVVDEESKAPTCVSLAVCTDEIISSEGW